MIICKFCRTTVLESGKLWDYHHQDSDSFKGSLRSQCVFCKRLAEGLGEINPWFDHNLKTKSLFRWNMRQVAQIRETKSHVSVTFRPVPGRACGDVKSDDLPEVTFYLFPEEDLGDIPEQHELGNRTDSDASKAQMIDWMQDCIANHPKCIRSHSIKSFIPTRVLDVGPPNTNTNDATPPSHIRVVDTTKEPITGPYMTLSHCWGTGSFIRLTETNVDEYTTNGIPWAELEASNANFADAVRVVRTLGMRYIWIDSLCIIQGQQHGEDWNHEAPLMHKVYRNSWCNLAAADSKHHTRGLFRERTAEVVPVRYESQEPSVTFGDKVWRILPADLWDRDLLGSHLYTRGWVFQERMLSPRLLQFTSTQLFWDCATLTATESLPDGLPPPLDTKSATDRHWRERLQSSALSVRPLAGTAEDSLEEFWKRAVAAYTSCDLTYGKDKLAALWGIAKLLRDALGEEYAAGLWGINLAEQLAWRVVDCSTAERYGEKERVVVPGGQAVGNPSWSWTSLKGEVEVAGRVPRLPRFYTACDHGGGNARFQIKKPLFGRFEGEHSTVWREEVVNMTRKLNRASERVSEKARVSGVTMITPIVEDIAEEEVGKDGTPKVATQPETKREFAMDKPSELLSASLRIQAHLCRGTLEASGAGHWTFTFPGLKQSDALIEAYPDIQPTENSMSYEMFLLAASKLLQNKWGHWFLDDGYVEDEDIAEVNYSGTGILVERVGEGRYKRIGSVVFRQMKRESWACLRRACGSGGMMLEDELQAEDGEKIWLE
ncbi:heterokaryon incompatibility protein [Colletotrichum abscissum]|uniref:Heterokaryon incompatibility protein n=1 Tax=Colletotrichum abscissum TaxID=1671311 RepID=A0A9Q0B8R5_9PEZI|nr:heterokaryon incompatibility protein [Colletotrichum abscissum]KAI3557749.1 heterokaryon incompatibility protein [Colletotrichum abscissum]KAK1510185.1 heterokaryon incompatibility protein [Colletotrichum abscissum]